MYRLSDFIVKHFKWTLLLSLVLGCVAVFFASQLVVSSNFEDILPEDSNIIKATNEFEVYFPSQDQALLVVSCDSDKAEEVLPKVSQSLSSSATVREVFYKLDFSSLGDKQYLYMTSHQTSSYISNSDQTRFMVIVKPILSDDFVASRNDFYETLESVVEQYTSDDVQIGITGGAFIQDLEADNIAFQGMGSKVLLTLVFIIVFVIISFRRVFFPMLTIYPLILGALLSAMAAYFIYGSLNMFSVSFTMLLLGLGIDFGVHFLSRYMEQSGGDKCANVKYTLKTTGLSIVVGGITTAFAFLAFVIAEFKALEQMGIISGVGVLLLVVTMLFVLPASLMLFPNPKEKESASSHHFVGIIKVTQKHRKIVLIAMLALVAINIMPAMNTKIVGDMEKIYPENLPSKEYEEILSEEFDFNVNTLTAMVKYDEGALDKIQDLNALKHVKNVQSIFSFLPIDQDTTIENLKEQGIELEPVTIEELPESLKNQYVSQDMLLIEIDPNFNVYDQKKYNEFAHAVYEIIGTHPVGIAPMMNTVIELSKSDIIRITGVCILAVFALLLWMFKSIAKAIKSVLPVVLTVYMTMTLLPMIGFDINVFSIAAFPMIIGIGIDGSIHLMHRIEESRHIDDWAKTIKAIWITSVTTMLGFASLGFINHPGMANLGMTVSVGMLVNFIFIILIIPTAMVRKE